MPYFIMFVFLLVIIFIFISGGTGKKINLNKELIIKYKELALNIMNQNITMIKNERRRYVLVNILTIFSLVGTFIFLTFCFKNIIYIIPVIIFIVLLIYLRTRNTKQVLYDIILPNLLKSYNNEIQYSHSLGISSRTYSEARFEYYDRFHSEDLIKGKINNCEYEMSEVHTERRHTDKDGHTHYTTIFRGTFAKVNLDKNFKSSINIVNNRIKLFSRDNYITIDNEEFEKIFDVFTTDKILAMRLLSPDVTTKMIDLYKNTGIYFEIKIVDNIMYIRFYTSSIMELSFSNTEKEAEQLARSIALLDSVFSIMNNFIAEIERMEM